MKSIHDFLSYINGLNKNKFKNSVKLRDRVDFNLSGALDIQVPYHDNIDFTREQVNLQCKFHFKSQYNYALIMRMMKSKDFTIDYDDPYFNEYFDSEEYKTVIESAAPVIDKSLRDYILSIKSGYMKSVKVDLLGVRNNKYSPDLVKQGVRTILNSLQRIESSTNENVTLYVTRDPVSKGNVFAFNPKIVAKMILEDAIKNISLRSDLGFREKFIYSNYYYLIAHEALHLLFGHVNGAVEYNKIFTPQLSNITMDCYINGYLNDVMSRYTVDSGWDCFAYAHIYLVDVLHTKLNLARERTDNEKNKVIFIQIQRDWKPQKKIHTTSEFNREYFNSIDYIGLSDNSVTEMCKSLKYKCEYLGCVPVRYEEDFKTFQDLLHTFMISKRLYHQEEIKKLAEEQQAQNQANSGQDQSGDQTQPGGQGQNQNQQGGQDSQPSQDGDQGSDQEQSSGSNGTDSQSSKAGSSKNQGGGSSTEIGSDLIDEIIDSILNKEGNPKVIKRGDISDIDLEAKPSPGGDIDLASEIVSKTLEENPDLENSISSTAKDVASSLEEMGDKISTLKNILKDTALSYDDCNKKVFERFSNLVIRTKEVYKMDVPSRKIRGLLGSEVDSRSTGLKDVVVIADLSGSMDKELLSKTIQQCFKTLYMKNRELSLDIIPFADRAKLYKGVKPNLVSILQVLNRANVGGGTKIRKVFELMEKERIRPKAVIILSDYFFSEQSLKKEFLTLKYVPTLHIAIDTDDTFGPITNMLKKYNIKKTKTHLICVIGKEK